MGNGKARERGGVTEPVAKESGIDARNLGNLLAKRRSVPNILPVLGVKSDDRRSN
jgi:hypothetical protein